MNLEAETQEIIFPNLKKKKRIIFIAALSNNACAVRDLAAGMAMHIIDVG